MNFFVISLRLFLIYHFERRNAFFLNLVTPVNSQVLLTSEDISHNRFFV